ncbi:hypothetical protein K5D34_11325 [Pseudomonas cichorii]|nr:hypothetical protein [Pseudomonas cichorii]MBX8510270.1 hypothetical protein [Pseudomonas cichorii]MBX8524060.1 hypothetical protein [Pseudomonas cichorii]MBX8563859.1 hypothetical protein [Pseudomonas cichorii]MBX8600834.1 hypothetical protein [Pseudomonas cichorii]
MESFWLAHQFIWTGIEAAAAVFLLTGLSRRYPNLHVSWIQALGLIAMFALMFMPHGYVVLFGAQKYEWSTHFGIEVALPHTKLLVADIAGAIAGFVAGSIAYLVLIANSKLSG